MIVYHVTVGGISSQYFAQKSEAVSYAKGVHKHTQDEVEVYRQGFDPIDKPTLLAVLNSAQDEAKRLMGKIVGEDLVLSLAKVEYKRRIHENSR